MGNTFKQGVSDFADEFSAKKLEMVGSTLNPFSDDRKGFSRKELEKELDDEISTLGANLSQEDIDEYRSEFYKRKQKELEEIEDKEPKRDYGEFKPAAQEKSSPYAVRTDVQRPSRRGFQDIDPRGYNQIQRGLGIVDLNKLLDDAMGTRAQMNVFNSLFGGGRGLL